MDEDGMPHPSKKNAKAPAPKKAGQLDKLWPRMRRSDKILMAIFVILVILVVVIVLTSYSFTSMEELLILFPLMGGIVAALFLIGIPVFAIYVKKGRVSTLWLILTLAVLSVVYMVSLFITNGGDTYPAPFTDYGMAGHLAYFFLFALVFLVLYIFVAFGMMWLMTFSQRQSVPEALDDIKGITAYGSDKDRSWKDQRYWKVLMLTFAFNVPPYLDTSTLKTEPGEPRKGIPLNELLAAFGWNMVFGIFVLTLITLNPFLKGMPAFSNVFGLPEFISFFLPLLVLSMGIFKRLGVGIRGQVKDFMLFDGLKSRITRSVLAVSTLVIFIRLAIQSLDWGMLLKFYEMFLDFTAVAIITTFVYFNYFEEDVASDIGRNWKG